MEDADIVVDLECLVCKEYLYIPVKQCITGHSFCESCHTKLEKCPVCQAEKAASRNFSIEAILLKLLFPCKYADDGCKVRENGILIRQHQEFCDFGKQQCPLAQSSKCTWAGRTKDLKQHAKENHEQHSAVENKTILKIKNFVPKPTSFIGFHMVVACNKLFKYCVNVDTTNNFIMWSVQFIGPRKEACNYSYALSFMDGNKNKDKFLVSSTCIELLEDQQTFDNVNCVLVHYDKLANFCADDGSLAFYFKIFLTEHFEQLLVLDNSPACLNSFEINKCASD